jgi:hypothetical protein
MEEEQPDAQDVARRRPRRTTGWVGQWLRSEEFWQGITIQTVGTILAAIILAFVAVMTGVGYTPAIRYYVILGIITLILIYMTLSSIVVVIQLASEIILRKRRAAPLMARAVWIYLTILAILSYSSLQDWSASIARYPR